MIKGSPLLFACCLFALVSCRQEAERSPVAMTKMEQVLLDMHLAEAYSIGLGDTAANGPKRFEKNYDSLQLFYAAILTHHGLTLKEFNKGLDWYRHHPGKLDTLYLNMLESLLERKADLHIPDLDAGQIPDEAGVHGPAGEPIPLEQPVDTTRQAAATSNKEQATED